MWDIIQRLLRRLLGFDSSKSQQTNSVIVNVLSPSVPLATGECPPQFHHERSTMPQTNALPGAAAPTIGEVEQMLRNHPRISGLLRHVTNGPAAEAAVLYFCRGIDNPAEKGTTKTWALVEQAFGQIRREATVR